MKTLFITLVLVLSFLGCTETNNSLKNKSIVISAPEIYASRLKTALEKYEANVILMPIIKTTVHDSLPELESNNYDYIVLPSRNAILAFDKEIKRKGNFNLWKQGPYYVIGKDIELLNKLGYHTSKNDNKPSLQGIAEAIKEEGLYKNKRLLLISPKIRGMQEPPIVPDFLNSIQDMHINYQRIDGYTTEVIDNVKIQNTIKKLQQGEYDMLAFTSGGECYALGSKISPFSLKCKIACFGPYTAKSAKRMNFKIDMISKEYHSFDDYVKNIVEYYCSKN